MKTRLSLPMLVSALFLSPLWGAEEILSKAPNRDAEVTGISGEGTGSIRLTAGGKTVWQEGLTYGVPSQTVISWSPHATKVAISVRGTKWSSTVHVFDTWQELKELPVADFSAIIVALNSGVRGRYLNVTPVGWMDEETLILRCSGNLVDGTSDGQDAANFSYQLTWHTPTRKVLGIVCTSKHDLNVAKTEPKAGAKER